MFVKISTYIHIQIYIQIYIYMSEELYYIDNNISQTITLNGFLSALILSKLQISIHVLEE